MKYFHKNIKGWFDFANYYGKQVDNAVDGSYFVEVGTYRGKSTAFMGVKIANSGKNIKFDAIDLFLPGNGGGTRISEDCEAICRQNLEPISEYVNIIKGCSVELSHLYEDFSLDFIFIDASHRYKDVLQDLKAWHPKLKQGKPLAGHDFNKSGVKKAVKEFAEKEGFKVRSFGICWEILKK